MTEEDEPRRLEAALALWSVAGSPVAAESVSAALVSALVLVPVRARLVSSGADLRTGRPAEKESEMDLVTLVGADGRTALLAFSTMARMAAWRSDVRPVTVAAVDLAGEARRLGAAAVVVDVAGPSFVVESTALDALAEGSWLSPD